MILVAAVPLSRKKENKKKLQIEKQEAKKRIQQFKKQQARMGVL